jgi:biopolymer transport protein ExbD
MKFKRARATRRGRIEIIPMIDVMFFLLATFMLASLSMQRLDGIAVTMPPGHAQVLPGAALPTLTIDRDNRVFVDRQAVALPQLAALLHSRLGADRAVLVAADAQASHGAVVEAMLQARRAGAVHFMLGVRRDD